MLLYVRGRCGKGEKQAGSGARRSADRCHGTIDYTPMFTIREAFGLYMHPWLTLAEFFPSDTITNV